ncbi:MAG: hypothetical protein MJZ34_02265 [Paludibacteraceae bacterium]|nr:hypothetical protein [Paludibacteraceae bacterium]
MKNKKTNKKHTGSSRTADSVTALRLIIGLDSMCKDIVKENGIDEDHIDSCLKLLLYTQEFLADYFKISYEDYNLLHQQLRLRADDPTIPTV